MAEATATALRGHVRSQRRVRTLSRGCWRLVVLLGLSWVALLLLGGTAHAAEEPRPAAPQGQPLPLLGKVLSNVEKTTTALPVRKVADTATQTLQNLGPRDVTIPEPVAAVAEPVASSTVAQASGSAPDGQLPALEAVDGVDAVTDSVRHSVGSLASGDRLLDVRLPSIEGTVSPLVDGVAQQLDTTVQAVADTTERLTVALPVAHPLPQLLGSLAGTVDTTTDVLTATTTAVTAAADQAVVALSDRLAPVLEAVSGPLGTITVSPSSGSGAAAGTTPTSDLGADTMPVVDGTFATVPTDAAQHTGVLHETATGGPAVPPPDSIDDSDVVVAQPATDIVTASPVPVSAAGSTTGSGGSAPCPSLDQTLVRVDVSEPEFAADVTEPIEGPAGPMPGTPAADPAFSPD